MEKTNNKAKRTLGFKLGIAQSVLYIVAVLTFLVTALSLVITEKTDYESKRSSFIGFLRYETQVDWDGDGNYSEDFTLYPNYDRFWYNHYDYADEYKGKPLIREFKEKVVDADGYDHYLYEYYDLVSEDKKNELLVFERRQTGEEVALHFSQFNERGEYDDFVKPVEHNAALILCLLIPAAILFPFIILQFMAAYKGSKSYHANNLGIAINTIFFGFGAIGLAGAVKDRKIALASDEKYLAKKRAKEQKRLEREQRELKENDGSYFSGGAVAGFFISWLTGVVSVITLGLAYPAMACWKLRWEARHTYIKGKRLRFDGKAMQFFGKFLLWLFLSVITLGVYYVFCMKVSVIKWQTKHTHFEDTVLSGEGEPASVFDGHAIQLFAVNWLCNFVTLITLSFGSYWAHCYKERWFCKHKTIDGLPLKFDGKAAQYFGKRIVWWLLTVVTLGVYGFWLKNRSKKWTASHTKIDDEKIAAEQPKI